MSLRQVIGSVKDQTSIGIAKVASNLAPELEIAVVKATSHDDDPADEKYIRRILNMTSSSRGYVNACVATVSKRLGKTRDWIVALKTLTLIHRLLNEGDPIFREEIMYATRRGARLLNLSDFKDEAHSSSWDQSAFVRTYGMYLDQKLELIIYERKNRSGGGSGGGSSGGANGSAYGEDRYGARDDFRSPPPRGGYEYSDRGDYGNYGGEMRRSRSYGEMRESREGKEEAKMATPLRDMKIEQIFGKMGHLQRLLDRFLGCRPPGLAKNSRLILIALYPIVKESFQIYSDICEVLAVLLDKFFDMEHQDCVKALDAYSSASKQIDELIAFYNWCKDTGVARSSEYPEVQRITGKLLETLDEFVRDRAKRPKSPERIEAPQPEEEPDMNEIKALPPPENYTPPPPPEVKPEPVPEPPKPQVVEPLVDLRDNGVTGDAQGNQLALALFAGPGGNNNGNGSWEQFPSNGGTEVTSAWQNPAAEAGKADWELALVETTSNLMNQKAAMGGGLDPLLLNGMYDQGMVRQQVSSASAGGGSASSVALPGPGKTTGQVLALPAPDGTVQMVNQDPFAASLGIAPPSYVQMADMEKKQNLLVHEQQVWGQYAANGMQGQVGLARVNGNGYYTQVPTPMMPYGMPPGNGAGYYNPPY